MFGSRAAGEAKSKCNQGEHRKTSKCFRIPNNLELRTIFSPHFWVEVAPPQRQRLTVHVLGPLHHALTLFEEDEQLGDGELVAVELGRDAVVVDQVLVAEERQLVLRLRKVRDVRAVRRAVSEVDCR